ncbi:MAG TPA: M20/M25/M40 family metallo-hydrolase [Conexibacter sp.]|nr:M20/M25/M40 family metallo-hydrolase [Conexibacter sp.]
MSATTNAAPERAAAWVAQRRGELIDHLCALVRTPSDNPPCDCGAAADVAQARCEQLGLETERHEVDPGGGAAPLPTVLAWLGARTRTPELILNAHLDASPPTPEWTVGAYDAERRDGRVWGRGATLSKSDVAAYAYALAGARDALGAAPARSAVLAITSDEGSGGDHGPRRLLEQLGLRPARAIAAGLTHRVGIAHAGALQLRLTVRGRAAHQAVVAPEQEAMRHAIGLAQRLTAFGDELRDRASVVDGIPHPTLNVTKLCGGELLGMAPGTVELLLDRRVLPSEDTGAALAELNGRIEAACSELGATVESELVQRAEPLRPTPAGEAWARVVQAEARVVLGEQVPLTGVPLYTDARWFGAHGIPTVLYGAGAEDLVGSGVNGADENVAEADVQAAAETVARVAARVLAGEA